MGGKKSDFFVPYVPQKGLSGWDQAPIVDVAKKKVLPGEANHKPVKVTWATETGGSIYLRMKSCPA